MRSVLFLLILLAVSIAPGYCQKEKPVHITGTILDAESLEPLPFVSVLIKNSGRGTVTDANGLFTLLAQSGDTIQFSIVGYLSTQLLVPTELMGERYALIELMQRETVVLKELEVYPWPTATQFQQVFTGVELPKTQDEQIREIQNKLQQTIKDTYPSEKYYYEQWRNRQLYEVTRQIPPNHFLDPQRWAEFISTLRKK